MTKGKASLTLRRDTHQLLKREAKRQNRSVSAVIDLWLEAHLATLARQHSGDGLLPPAELRQDQPAS